MKNAADRLSGWAGFVWFPAWSLVIVLVSTLAAGCSFDARSSALDSCSQQYPCPVGEMCVEGLCTPINEADGFTAADGSMDADASDGNAHDVDESDAGESDAGESDAGETGDTSDADELDAGDADELDAGDADTSMDAEPDAQPDSGLCEDGRAPQVEVCDGLDNDCDGVVDNHLSDVSESCDTGGLGACRQGQTVCNGGQLECEQIVFSAAEVCNGADDDCDGTIDEEAQGVGDSCQSGEPGVCGDGELRCDFGQLACQPLLSPVAEICDGLDNDCDGAVDEAFPDQGQACETGEVGRCAQGSKQCVGAQIQCEPVHPASSEQCDGLDNDCDGLVDEDEGGAVLSTACGAASCPGSGVSLCIGAQWTTCEEDIYETCNGADSNCDSQPDNPTPCYAVCPGGGIATGTLDCSTSPATCELPQEICTDGADNDCDGQIDEDCQGGNERDGMVFVPGGPFWMGSQSASFGFQADESPQHLVELAPFYIDQAEVTRGDYQSCWSAGACSLPQWGCPYQGAGSTSNYEDKPIACLSYSQAEDFCQWAGKRLPTAAEWEKAARGPYPRMNLFPWGDVQDATLAVVDCGSGLNSCSAESLSYSQGASYYGALHMAGNVAEWVSDYYDANFYTSMYTVAPMQSVDQGDGHEVRGGSYDQTLPFARVSNRAALPFATVDDDAVGFRCAMDAP